jgi:hypothetical protein
VKTEQELAAHIVAYLRDLDFEVYQEVSINVGPVLDICAKRGPMLWAIECKTKLNQDVCEQAVYWTRRAHLVSVATAQASKAFVLKDYLYMHGIGRIVVHDYGEHIPIRVEEVTRAAFRRRVEGIELHEAQKTYAKAGTNRGGYYSPFKATCDALREFLKHQPNPTVRDAARAISHHYTSSSAAAGSLYTWAKAGRIPGVGVSKGRPLRFEIRQN